MAKLHELLAVEPDLEGNYKKILEETKNTFTKKSDHFFGFHRRLELFGDDKHDTPEEYKEMATTVHAKLDYQKKSIVRYLDAVLQKEATNQQAIADLTIDGIEIAKGVPATFLLGLENKLKQVRAVYEVSPTLPPGHKWVPDETKGDHVYSMDHPEEQFKSEKIFKVQVLYDATKEHPAQVEKIPETKDVGKYVKHIWSGMISPAEKSVILGRIDKVIRGVKKARQRANATEVVKRTIGKEIFKYIDGE
ncbi:hypothetical protein LCGC14_2472220 [marine sediment metagenome]|uniref:Uncharacterized protein n=1 Tax=marine sediment metagenome TaxID=412755 RepID=A0A0F9E3Z4_9ZZZZ